MESITHHVNPHIVEEIKRYNEASTATQPTPA